MCRGKSRKMQEKREVRRLNEWRSWVGCLRLREGEKLNYMIERKWTVVSIITSFADRKNCEAPTVS